MSTSSRPLHTAYIALGSNVGSGVGDPAATVHAGLAALVRAIGGSRPAVSSLYETAPVGFREQPVFVNAAARVCTTLGPDALLQAMLGVERGFGRMRDVPQGPRTLDLDLLMVDDMVLSTATLTLPHPRMEGRRFVLAPLAEIAPGLRHPVLGRTMAELLEALPDEGEQAVAGVRRVMEEVKG